MAKFALTDLTAEELKKCVAALGAKGSKKPAASVEDEDEEETDDEETEDEALAKKPGKKSKPAPTDDDEDESEEETEDEDSDDDESEDEDGPNLETVIKAFKAFVKKKDRKAANAILKKFKVTSVSDLKESDYPKVLKMLK